MEDNGVHAETDKWKTRACTKRQRSGRQWCKAAEVSLAMSMVMRIMFRWARKEKCNGNGNQREKSSGCGVIAMVMVMSVVVKPGLGGYGGSVQAWRVMVETMAVAIIMASWQHHCGWRLFLVALTVAETWHGARVVFDV